MSIKHITTDDLRRMKDSEGLILQGCGGDLNEWVDGINDLLTKEGILRNGTRFEDCSSFEHNGLTCLLFPFGEGTDINVGRLAMWRLQTHDNFGGTWLSDYVDIHFGGFVKASPGVGISGIAIGQIENSDLFNDHFLPPNSDTTDFDEDCDEGMEMSL